MSEPLEGPGDPPGVFQYNGGVGPNRQTTVQGFYMEGFAQTPERDAQWIAMMEEEATLRGQGEIVSFAKAIDNWNVERDLLPPE